MNRKLRKIVDNCLLSIFIPIGIALSALYLIIWMVLVLPFVLMRIYQFFSNLPLGVWFTMEELLEKGYRPQYVNKETLRALIEMECMEYRVREDAKVSDGKRKRLEKAGLFLPNAHKHLEFRLIKRGGKRNKVLFPKPVFQPSFGS